MMYLLSLPSSSFTYILKYLCSYVFSSCISRSFCKIKYIYQVVEMHKHMMSLLLVYVLGFLASSKLVYGSIVGGFWNRSCIESEKQALLLFKESFVDDYNYLSSWVGDNCCAWHGVGCNNKTGHIMQLDLSSGSLRGSQIPSSLLNLKYLGYLDLSWNIYDEIQIPEFLGSFNDLTYLNLSYCNFKGLVPHHLGNLSSLRYFDLNYNQLTIDSMMWLSKLSSLEYLDFTFVNLSGAVDWFPAINMLSDSFSVLILYGCELPDNIHHHLPVMNLTSLVSLELGYNQLNSFFSPWVFNNSGLAHLSLVSNELSGRLPEALCQLSKLEELDVNYNKLSGSIPNCIGQLSNLRRLGLYSNSWEGFVSEHHFVNLTRLAYLFISSKSNIVWNINSKWVPPFQLQLINMNSFNVGPKFPQWLLTQTHISYIVMQNVSISDTIPHDWFLNVLLSNSSYVDLSNNDINGELPSLFITTPNGLETLVLSKNRFSGELPAFLCNLTSMWTLVLSNNNFSGELLQCIGNLTELRELDVMNNSFSGNIPLSLGSLRNLTYLNLHDNKFHGKLPLSFRNLTSLVTFDVGKNNLSDILPSWTREQVPFLTFLMLQSNNFYGEIPTQLCQHSSIQLLNLAWNQITGKIPPCFGNISAMISGDQSQQGLGFILERGGTIIDDAKGYEQRYTSTLEFLFSINLSNNNLSGEIPEELMDLKGLLNLNLAGNHLAGRIPDRIGKLNKLESLDLSRNVLYGAIPQSLSDLNFLSRLNLSFNNLSGRIPTGNQLQTLEDPSIYAGNNQLCGRPILTLCDRDTDAGNVHDYNNSDDDSDDERMWFYAGIGPGLLVGFLGFCAALHFIKSWRYFYFHLVEQVFDNIAVAITLFTFTRVTTYIK